MDPKKFPPVQVYKPPSFCSTPNSVIPSAVCELGDVTELPSLVHVTVAGGSASNVQGMKKSSPCTAWSENGTEVSTVGPSKSCYCYGYEIN